MKLLLTKPSLDGLGQRGPLRLRTRYDKGRGPGHPGPLLINCLMRLFDGELVDHALERVRRAVLGGNEANRDVAARLKLGLERLLGDLARLGEGSTDDYSMFFIWSFSLSLSSSSTEMSVVI